MLGVCESAHAYVKQWLTLTIRTRLRIMPDMNKPKKNPHAVALGRKGGKKGGAIRAAKMSPEERSESARKAALARWSKHKKAKRSKP